MSVEWFLKLKEIDSLTKMKHNCEKLLKEQNDRIQALESKRHETYLQTTKLKQDLVAKQQLMGDLEAKIKLLSEQKQRLIDFGGEDKKILSIAQEINALEESGLEFLEEVDALEENLRDNKTFLKGLEKTTEEISKESSEEVAIHHQEISRIDLRVNALMEELPSDYKRIFSKVTAKNLAHGPFTRIDQGSCYFCRYKISRIDESQIDMEKGLKTCPQCSRIFLPYGA